MKSSAPLSAALFLFSLILQPLLHAQDTPPETDDPAPEAKVEKTTAAPDVEPFEELCGYAAQWEMTPQQFEEKFRRSRAQWLDAGKTQAQIGNVMRRVDDRPVPHKIMQGKLPVVETLVHFTNEKLSRVQFSVYNKGDAGAMKKEAFEKLVAEATAVLKAKTGKEPANREKTKSAVKLHGFTFADAATNYLLEYSFERETSRQPFRAEFIRLVLLPKPEKEARQVVGGGAPAMPSVARSSLAANVKKETNGDVYIGSVPMVDQGQKGYCAVATTERVLRYYKIPVDQHEMAQAADSSAGGGTNMKTMVEALDRLEGRFKFRLKKIMPYDPREYVVTVREYNRAARSAKKEPVDVKEHESLDSLYSAMDAQVLKTAKSRPASLTRFSKYLHSYIDNGIPIMWGVTLGIFKETDIPQSIGGHMRLIIGYNETKKELIYSDSWGSGHEMKRMPLDQAVAMTDGLYAIEPLLK